MPLDRRDFLKKGFAFGAAFSFADLSGLFAADAAPAIASKTPHLVAVRNGTRIEMLNAAIASLGGMKAFVKPGQTVVIKPNIGWDVVPELGANTHPDIVRRLVELCDEAGAKEITVFDNTCDAWQRAYEHSGIQKALEGTRAKLINGKDESMYRVVTIPGATKLLDVKVHSLVLDSDVYINAPVLKHHSGAGMTCSMKNAMGVVWDRRYWHKNDLHQCIAEFQTFKKPALNIVDAYHPMMRNGPRGTNASDVVEMKCLIASTDPVAADAAAAKLLGHQPTDIRYIPIAAGLGLGSLDLETMNIQRLQLS